MLDIKLIREKPDYVRENLKRRGDPEKLEMLDRLIECDREWRKNLTELNELRHQRRKITNEIAQLKRKGEEITDKIEAARKIDAEIEVLEKKVRELEEKVSYYLMRIPNLLHESVPYGVDENDNVTVKTWGEIP